MPNANDRPHNSFCRRTRREFLWQSGVEGKASQAAVMKEFESLLQFPGCYVAVDLAVRPRDAVINIAV